MLLRLRIILFCLLGALLITPARAAVTAQTTDSLAILSPLPGEAVQGSRPITGRVVLEGLAGWELTFGYAADPTQTWFLIVEGVEAVSEGKLADWDTSTLTDGNYTLRLLARRADGSTLTAMVENVRVRNYSPVETSTPTITPKLAPQATQVPPTPTFTLTPSATPIPPTPTPLPPNPVIVSPLDLGAGLLRGILAAAVTFGLIGVYAWAAKARKH